MPVGRWYCRNVVPYSSVHEHDVHVARAVNTAREDVFDVRCTTWPGDAHEVRASRDEIRPGGEGAPLERCVERDQEARGQHGVGVQDDEGVVTALREQPRQRPGQGMALAPSRIGPLEDPDSSLAGEQLLSEEAGLLIAWSEPGK